MRRLLLLAFVLAAARDSTAERALPDYRYFRALSIDLAGRPPTRDEIAAFERPDFDLDRWLAGHLAGPDYAERLRRVYMDLLRLEIGPAFTFVPNALMLRRQEVLGPDGPVYVYFRRGQRRFDPAIDGEFCFTADETGQQYADNAPPTGTPTLVSRELLDERTLRIKPWWLYADYRATEPLDRLGPSWAQRFPGFSLAPELVSDQSGREASEIRVCREEAQTGETGGVYVSGRTGKPGEPRPRKRRGEPPRDSAFARANPGRQVSCLSGTGFQNSVECGCGIGLERCLPGGGFANEPPAFLLPTHTPLGPDAPFESRKQPAAAWQRLWWSEEAKHFLDQIFLEDRDFREVLTSRATVVNGPLAQFYRLLAGATCCGSAADLGYSDPVPLVEPGAIPDKLIPQDTATWLPVADRGPRAVGILTMPIFLTKYGSRRARAHAVYSAFLCRDFAAETARLVPSNEPDLTRRPGCAACHQTLEPMAAYFTRVAESDWTWLPASALPMANQRCTTKSGPGACKTIYDPAFAMLRGGYASRSHAETGPRGLATEITGSPEFAACVAQNVAQSLLGQTLGPDDAAWKTELARRFVDGGYRMRALVKAIVTSPRYRDANDERKRSDRAERQP